MVRRLVWPPTSVDAVPVQLGQYPAPSHVVAHLSDPHLLAGPACSTA